LSLFAPLRNGKREDKAAAMHTTARVTTRLFIVQKMPKKIVCAAGRILTDAGNPRDTQQAGITMCQPQYNVSVVFHQKLRQVLVSLYILLHQILAAKGQGLKTLTSGKQAANVKMSANISKAEKLHQ
jgi:hypothetical protein